MTERFDPYHRWLNIPPAEQPPNHYRLLGISLFEDDAEVIETATNRQMARLRQYQSGPHSELSKKLLVRIKKVRAILLDPEKKDAYDALLRDTAKTNSPQDEPRRRPKQPLSKEPLPSAEPNQNHPLRENIPAKAPSSRKMPSTLTWKLILAGVAVLLILVLLLRPNGKTSQETPSDTTHFAEGTKSLQEVDLPEGSFHFDTSDFERDEIPSDFLTSGPTPVQFAEDIDLVLPNTIDARYTELTSTPGSRYALVHDRWNVVNAVVDFQDGKLLGVIQVKGQRLGGRPAPKGILSPDGKYYVTSMRGYTPAGKHRVLANIWLVSTGKQIGSIDCSKSLLEDLEGLVVTHRGELVLISPFNIRSNPRSTERHCFAEIWKLPECRLVANFNRQIVPQNNRQHPKHPSFITGRMPLPMISIGDYVYIKIFPKDIHLCYLPERRFVGSLNLVELTGSITVDTLGFSPNGRWLASVKKKRGNRGSEKCLTFIDITKQKAPRTLTLPNLEINYPVRSFQQNRRPIEWLPDSKYCVVDRVNVIDIERGKQIGRISSANRDNRYFTGGRRAFGLWNPKHWQTERSTSGTRLTNYRYLMTSEFESGDSSSIRYHLGRKIEPDSAPMPKVSQWSFSLGKTCPDRVYYQGPICVVRFAPTINDQGKKEHPIVFLDWRTGEVKGRVSQISNEPRNIIVDPEGTYWAQLTDFGFKTVNIRSIQNDQFHLELKNVQKAMFLPDQKILIATRHSGSHSNYLPNSVEKWDLSRGRLEEVIYIPTAEKTVALMAVSPGGRYLAIFESKSLEIFDLKTSESIGKRELDTVFHHHMMPENFTLDFSPKGDELLLTKYVQVGRWHLDRWNFVLGNGSTCVFPKNPYALENNHLTQPNHHSINWTADQSCWIIGDRILVEPQTGKIRSSMRNPNRGQLFLNANRLIDARKSPTNQDEWVLGPKDLDSEEFACIIERNGKYIEQPTIKPKEPKRPEVLVASKPEKKPPANRLAIKPEKKPPANRLASKPEKKPPANRLASKPAPKPENKGAVTILPETPAPKPEIMGTVTILPETPTPEPERNRSESSQVDPLNKTPVEETPSQPEIPSISEQQESLQLLREVLDKEYAYEKSAKGKQVLVDALIDISAKLSDDPNALYVALRDAAKNAALIGHIDTAFFAMDEISTQFKSEPWDLWIAISQSMSRSLRAQKDQIRLANRLNKIIEKAIRSQQFDTAEKLIQMNEAFAGKFQSQTLAEQCNQARFACDQMKILKKEYFRQFNELNNNPRNPTANEKVGLWTCCIEEQWSKGLKLLSRGANTDLRSAANAELSEPKTTELRLDLANQWWDYSRQVSPFMAPSMKRRAAYWYEMILSDLSGKDRPLVESRLQQMKIKFGGNVLE